MHIQLIYGQRYEVVLVDGEPLDPGPSQRVLNHSPDGFSWSYGGSGPAQLALALLLHAGVEDEEAVEMHQLFKNATVATWPRSDYEVDLDVDRWVERWRENKRLRDTA